MTPELEKLISEIQDEKIKEILQAGEHSPMNKTFVDAALETLARRVIYLERGGQNVRNKNTYN